VPEVRPPFLPRQEEEVRGLRIRSHHDPPKIFLAEQEDQQNSHSLIGANVPKSIPNFILNFEIEEKWAR